MAYSQYTGKTDYIASLDDQPNDIGGLTAAELKATFDKAVAELVIWFNSTHLSELPTTEEITYNKYRSYMEV